MRKQLEAAAPPPPPPPPPRAVTEGADGGGGTGVPHGAAAASATSPDVATAAVPASVVTGGGAPQSDAEQVSGEGADNGSADCPGTVKSVHLRAVAFTLARMASQDRVLSRHLWRWVGACANPSERM